MCPLVYLKYTVYCVAVPPAPPLTLENVMEAVKGVKKMIELDGWLNVMAQFPDMPSLRDIIERFLKGGRHYQPSWRRVIWALDGAGETLLADRIRHYAEPVHGR